MRAIRKVQTQCTLLELCINNPNIQNTIYDGYVFDKFERNDGMVQYIVYVDSLKLVLRITSRIHKIIMKSVNLKFIHLKMKINTKKKYV